jgi:competence protein ComEC
LSAGILIRTFIQPDQLTFILLLIPLLIVLIKYPLLYFFLFLPIGFFITPDYSPDPRIEEYLGNKISATGTLIKNPENRENSIRLFIRLNSINPGNDDISVNTKVVAYLENTNLGLTYGDKIELQKVRFEKIKNFKNPGSFNIADFYKRKNIFFTTYVNSKNIKVLGKNGDVNPFLYIINLLRTEYGRFVRSNTEYPQSEIITALTVGDKSNIPTQLRESFSGLGISHIFAISGLHVGAIAVAFYFLFKWVLKRSEYILLKFQMPRVAASLTILPVFTYTALAGFSTSALRAFIMITIYLLSIVLGKDDVKLNTLFIAALIILLINPNSLFELSFQLSFLSVFGILLFHIFYPLVIRTGVDKLKTALKTTVAATFITLPISINTFGYLPVLSVPANLILIPLVEFVIVPLGLITLVTFRLSSSLSIPILNIDSYFISILLHITGWIDKHGLALVSCPRVDFFTTVFIMLTGLLILLGTQYKKLKYLIPITLSLSIVFGIINFFISESGNLEIHILDSGKKSIALIKTPSSKSILISGGYSYKSKSDFIERSVVNPYLLSRNITELDHLVLSSLDKSHLKGAEAILKKIDVKNIWINGHKLNSDLWEQIYTKKIKLNRISGKDYSVSIDGLNLSFLRPLNSAVYDSKKPAPLLLELTKDDFTFHMGEEIEHTIFNNKKSNLLYISNYAENNHDSIKNRYNPETIICGKCKKNSKINQYKKYVYETASDGTVSVIVKNSKIKIKKYIKQ